ncbi:MAG: prephenate dehydrogenase/arogenate dehydrogenase family protein, partial [Prolixibacteraceae bacterium]|nr:prephenate dehydrogenase/arogenate dehydrogenase family protein [Burkholderiales bacterium]
MRAFCLRWRWHLSEIDGRILLQSVPYLSEFSCDRLVVIGVGLIGGSVAAALRRAGKVRRIVGVGRGRANIERALELGVIDEAIDDVSIAARGADIILLAVPVQQNDRVLAKLAGWVATETLITDAGSTKVDYVAAVRRLLPLHLSHVVPAHPIAGAELTGVDAAN